MIDKKLVNLSAVAAASNMHVMSALYKTTKNYSFLVYSKTHLHDPNLDCLRKNADISKLEIGTFQDFFSASYNEHII